MDFLVRKGNRTEQAPRCGESLSKERSSAQQLTAHEFPTHVMNTR